MRRYYTYRFALILSTLLLCQSLYACSLSLAKPTINDFNSKSLPEVSVTPDYSTNILTPAPSKDIVTPTEAIAIITTAPTKAPFVFDEKLNVRGKAISLGESTYDVIRKLGSPNRIVDTEYNFDYYIYNNDYSRLLFVAVNDSEVVGFYSDSLDFNFNGISSGASINAVGTIFGKTFTMAEILTYDIDQYSIKVLMDQLGSKKVTGIYVLKKSIEQDGYTDSVLSNIELMIYDLTNSVRVRNNESVLSWSSSAALAARKHSVDMAINNYFDHRSPARTKPGDRMKAEGIAYRTYGENIIGGYGTAILSNHGWFNSSGHRKNLLNPNFRYLGVGFTYNSDSTYQTYITQDFYR